jgi:hypothetical protein
MDLYRIIRELSQERDRLQRIIESLEEMKPFGKIPVRQEGKRRGRKSMDNKARAEVSERMKRYWKLRRTEKEASQKAGVGRDHDGAS